MKLIYFLLKILIIKFNNNFKINIYNFLFKMKIYIIIMSILDIISALEEKSNI